MPDSLLEDDRKHERVLRLLSRSSSSSKFKNSIPIPKLESSLSLPSSADTRRGSLSSSKRANSTGNFLETPSLMKRVTSFSELHKMTRSSTALNRLKQIQRQKPVMQEEFDVRMKDMENEIKRLRCEVMMLRRCYWEKTQNNSRTFMRMTKLFAWVTGLHLLALRVLAFVRRRYKQDIIKNLTWSLCLRLMRSIEGRKQLRMYLNHVVKHQLGVLTVKISPDLISLFCLSRPNEMFRICGFIVVLFNDQIQLYKQHYYPKRDAPKTSSILANIAANLLFVLVRWWIIAEGLPTAVRSETRTLSYRRKGSRDQRAPAAMSSIPSLNHEAL